jgi:hypothetical protein
MVPGAAAALSSSAASACQGPAARRGLCADDALRRRISQVCDWPWQQLPMYPLVASSAAVGNGRSAVCHGSGPHRMGRGGRNPAEVPGSVPIPPYTANENVPDRAIHTWAAYWVRRASGRFKVCLCRFGGAGWIDDRRQRSRGRLARRLLRCHRTDTQRNQTQQGSHKPPLQVNRRSRPWPQ